MFDWIQKQIDQPSEAQTEQRIRLEVELSHAKVMLEKAKNQNDIATLTLQESLKLVALWDAQVDSIRRAIRAVDLQ